MSAFVDFEFYTDTYQGNTIPEADFVSLANSASALVNAQSFGRAESTIDAGTDTVLVGKIKMATCAAAEVFYQDSISTAGSGPIQSESIGNYSVTYALSEGATFNKEQKASLAVRLYLETTGILYKGLDE